MKAALARLHIAELLDFRPDEGIIRLCSGPVLALVISLTGGAAMNARSVIFARKADIKPGELALFEVAGRRIAVANADGRFFAIDDTCTHEQCSLAEDGTLEGTVVTCGCHGAQFDVTTGAVLAPPAPEPVKAYPVRVERDDLMLEI
jgi:nitrite reductase/ring-hydroxylating ferredoxin subunit